MVSAQALSPNQRGPLDRPYLHRGQSLRRHRESDVSLGWRRQAHADAQGSAAARPAVFQSDAECAAAIALVAGPPDGVAVATTGAGFGVSFWATSSMWLLRL